MNIRNTVSAAALAAALLGSLATMASAADYSQEKTNLVSFHMIDFIGWNNKDMDVMRTYHGAEVGVDMAGTHTDGIDAHVEVLTERLSQGREKIVQHSPSVAQGEWTAVVSLNASGSFATFGKWKDGALSDEYLFFRPLTADEIAAVDVSKPIASFTTPDDQDLRAATGAEAGWSALLLDGYAILTQTTDGQVTKQLGFASL